MKIKDILISIIIPTNNRSAYLSRAVRSIINQTYNNWECIIIDDNSIEGAEVTLKNIIKNDKRFKIIRNKKTKFASESRNIGIRQAKGKFIAFLDDDDYWIDNKLELQMNFMLKNNLSVSYCWSYIINKDSSISFREPIFNGNIFDLMLDDQPLCNCSTFIVEKQSLENVGLFNKLLKRGNDGDLMRKLSRYNHIGVLKKKLVYYQVDTDGKNISTNNKLGIKRSLKSYKYRLLYFKNDLSQRPTKLANIYLEISKCYSKLGLYKISTQYFFKASNLYLTYFLKIVLKLIKALLLIILIK